MTEIRDVAPGLWMWSTPHPDWTPESDFDATRSGASRRYAAWS